MAETKLIALTRQEAEYVLDSFKVSNPTTRELALKVASIVLEYAAEDAVVAASKQVAPYDYGTARAE